MLRVFARPPERQGVTPRIKGICHSLVMLAFKFPRVVFPPDKILKKNSNALKLLKIYVSFVTFPFQIRITRNSSTKILMKRALSPPEPHHFIIPRNGKTFLPPGEKTGANHANVIRKLLSTLSVALVADYWPGRRASEWNKVD